MKYFDDIEVGDRMELGTHTFTADDIKTFARAIRSAAVPSRRGGGGALAFRRALRLGLAHRRGVDAADGASTSTREDASAPRAASRSPRSGRRRAFAS